MHFTERKSSILTVIRQGGAPCFGIPHRYVLNYAWLTVAWRQNQFVATFVFRKLANLWTKELISCVPS